MLGLKPEQRLLGVEPATEPGQVAGAADDPVARHYDRDRISTVCGADRTYSFRSPDALCDFTVARCLSVGNVLQCFKDADLELCAERIVEFTQRRRRILNLVQDALGQLRLDMKYLMFDLEATRRERDEFKARLISDQDSGPEQD